MAVPEGVAIRLLLFAPSEVGSGDCERDRSNRNKFGHVPDYLSTRTDISLTNSYFLPSDSALIGGFERLAIVCLYGDTDRRGAPLRRSEFQTRTTLLLEAIELRHQSPFDTKNLASTAENLKERIVTLRTA